MGNNRSDWEFPFSPKRILEGCVKRLAEHEAMRDDLRPDFELISNQLNDLDVDPKSENDMQILKREQPEAWPLIKLVLDSWQTVHQRIRDYERWQRTLEEQGPEPLLLCDADIEFFGL